MTAMRLTKTCGIPVYVNSDQVLYWFGTEMLGRPSEKWTRIVFSGVGDGAALGVRETPEEIAAMFNAVDVAR
jgi:hypothetical protein